MEDESYWYYVNGKLKQHLNPPSDPSNVTFAHVKITDTGYAEYKAEITLCIEGKYIKPHVIASFQYKTPIKIRERAEIYVKDILKEHRTITDWNSTKFNKKKSTSKRCNKK
jgi:hypothetical protein